jgi:GNAT superfamily N-acetyltransferase
MAGIEQFAVVQLEPGDAGAGLALSTEAHWNQNEADWRFFLREGTVFGVRDQDSRLIGTAALLPYAFGNAWISMVLVTASWRRHGLATNLVDACMALAGRQNLTTWLDATAAGAAVYGPLGFTPTQQLRRLRRANVKTMLAAPEPLRPAGSLDAFITRDRRAIGFDRHILLTELGGRPASQLRLRDGAMAFVRDGRTARHIGPLFAEHADQALALVDDIVRSETGPVLIDAVSTQEKFVSGLTASGWTVERSFQRMRFGRPTAQPAELPFAVAGPEYG